MIKHTKQKDFENIDLTIFDKNWNKLTKKEKQVRINTKKRLKQILGEYPKDTCLEFIVS